MKPNDEKIERLERKVLEQQQCLKDKDKRISVVEEKIKDFKKTGVFFLLLIPFILLIGVTFYGFLATDYAFETLSYDTETWSRNPLALPFLLYTLATIVLEILVFFYLYRIFIVKEND